MKVNLSKSRCFLVSRSRTVVPFTGDLLLQGFIAAQEWCVHSLGSFVRRQNFHLDIRWCRYLAQLRARLVYSERLTPCFVMCPSLPVASFALFFLYLSIVHRWGLRLLLVICTSLIELCVPLVSSVKDRSRATWVIVSVSVVYTWSLRYDETPSICCIPRF